MSTDPRPGGLLSDNSQRACEGARVCVHLLPDSRLHAFGDSEESGGRAFGLLLAPRRLVVRPVDPVQPSRFQKVVFSDLLDTKPGRDLLSSDADHDGVGHRQREVRSANAPLQ